MINKKNIYRYIFNNNLRRANSGKYYKTYWSAIGFTDQIATSTSTYIYIHYTYIHIVHISQDGLFIVVQKYYFFISRPIYLPTLTLAAFHSKYRNVSYWWNVCIVIYNMGSGPCTAIECQTRELSTHQKCNSRQVI